MTVNTHKPTACLVRSRTSYHEITKDIKKIIQESKIIEGIVVVTTVHTTFQILEEMVHDRN